LQIGPRKLQIGPWRHGTVVEKLPMEEKGGETIREPHLGWERRFRNSKVEGTQQLRRSGLSFFSRSWRKPCEKQSNLQEMKGIMERRKMRMMGSPLMATRAWSACACYRRRAGRAGAVGRSVLVTRERNEGGRRNGREMFREKSPGGLPLRDCQAKGARRGWRGHQWVRCKAACPPRFSNVLIHKYMYKHSFAK
jgi:hypothetical protein